MIRSKRFFTLFLLLSALLRFAWADAVEDFIAVKAVNAPSTAVLVTDLKTGRRLAAYNSDKLLIPASIMKGVTTATLIEKVGPKYVYVTPVYLTAPVSQGVVDGNLLVVASGDPSINSKNEPKTADFISEIVSALRDAGVTRINGGIIVDESAFPGPAINANWSAGDLPHAYGTGTHGFNFEDNCSGKQSVREPAEVFRARLRKALQAAGIAIGTDELPGRERRKLLCEHRSATIDEIMRSCMMRSDNQFAEAMLRLVGDKYGSEGSVTKGAERMMKYWDSRKALTDGIQIVDGSGLSRANRLSAEFMGNVLTIMARNLYYASFFPLAGQEGTLRHLLAGTALEGYVAMKTGSMSGIQCYAGYKLDEDYVPTHTVVIMMNEMGDRAAARKAVERLLLALFPSE